MSANPPPAGDPPSAPVDPPVGVPRRRLLQGAAAGTALVWAAPSILSVDAAAAATLLCETISWTPFSVDIDDLPNTPAVVPYGTAGSATLAFADGTLAPVSSIAGYALVSPLGDETDQITLGMTANPSGIGDSVTLTIDFDVPVQNLMFDLLDVDLGSGNWQDLVRVDAYDGATPIGLTLANATYDATYVAGTTIGTTLELAGILDPSGTGTGVANTSTDANVAISIAGPVTQLVLTYQAGPGTPASPQPQQIGLGPLTLCS